MSLKRSAVNFNMAHPEYRNCKPLSRSVIVNTLLTTNRDSAKRAILDSGDDPVGVHFTLDFGASSPSSVTLKSVLEAR